MPDNRNIGELSLLYGCIIEWNLLPRSLVGPDTYEVYIYKEGDTERSVMSVTWEKIYDAAIKMIGEKGYKPVPKEGV